MTKDIAELLLTNRGCVITFTSALSSHARVASRLSRPKACLTSLSIKSPELQLEQITWRLFQPFISNPPHLAMIPTAREQPLCHQMCSQRNFPHTGPYSTPWLAGAKTVKST